MSAPLPTLDWVCRHDEHLRLFSRNGCEQRMQGKGCLNTIRREWCKQCDGPIYDPQDNTRAGEGVKPEGLGPDLSPYPGGGASPLPGPISKPASGYSSRQGRDNNHESAPESPAPANLSEPFPVAGPGVTTPRTPGPVTIHQAKETIMNVCKTPGCSGEPNDKGYCASCWGKKISEGKRRAEQAKARTARPDPKPEPPKLVRIPGPDPRDEGAAMLGRFVQEQAGIYFAAGEKWSCSKKSSANLMARLVRALGEAGHIPGWEPGRDLEAA
jgi:hypothetical protein